MLSGGATAKAAEPTPPPRGTSVVRIVTTDPEVALERRVGSLDARQIARPAPDWEADWERVCRTPCGAPVALGGEYRIGGRDVAPSAPFGLRGPRATLEVRPGSASARSFGAYAAVFGYVIAATGALVMATALMSTEQASAEIDEALALAGGGVLAGGTALGTLGVGLYLANETTVTDQTQRRVARDAKLVVAAKF